MSRPFLLFLGFMAMVAAAGVAAFRIGLIPAELILGMESRPVTRMPAAPPPKKARATLALEYPPPESLNLFIGPEGTDEDGYPKRLPNGVAILAMLHARQFDLLTRHLEGLQAKFEKDYRQEYVLDRAYRSFDTADPAVTELLDAWAKAAPTSPVPIVARSFHELALGWKARGTKFAADTPDEQMDRMRVLHESAVELAERARDMQPKALAPHIVLILLAKTVEGSRGGARRLDAATELCPLCVLPHVYNMFGITPRWGGSDATMEAAAQRADALVPQNPRFTAVRATADAERCKILRDDEQVEEAKPVCDRAARVHSSPTAAYQRALLLSDLERHQEVRKQLEIGLEYAPNDTDMLRWLARLDAVDRRWAEAVEHQRAAWLLDPADENSNEQLAEMVEWLETATRTAYFNESNAPKALELAELGLSLSPKSRILNHLRDASKKGIAAGQELDARADAARKNPDSFEHQKAYDDALSGLGRIPETLDIWNPFLAKQPDHAGALSYRGGSYMRLAKYEEARADFQRACDLGDKGSCGSAKTAAGWAAKK